MLATLSTIRRHDACQYGNKAASLGELLWHGFRVPDGLVVPAATYAEYVTDTRLATLVAARTVEIRQAPPARLLEIESEILDSFRSVRLPADTVAQILEWTGDFGTFAVRSSGTHEDLPGASFAGQYDSFLEVTAEEVPASVVRCFASVFSARVAVYRRRKQIGGTGAMAVIVQQMVAADHAGVVFTRAPGRPESMLIECAPGLGDAVVSGRVSPSRYYISRASLRIEKSSLRYPLHPGVVEKVAHSALSIETCLGAPQDIEWGVSNGSVYILQARPLHIAPRSACATGE